MSLIFLRSPIAGHRRRGRCLRPRYSGIRKSVRMHVDMLAVEIVTPCTSTLLAVERDTVCTSIGCGNGYILHVHTAGGGNRYTMHVHNCRRWKGIHPAPPFWWLWCTSILVMVKGSGILESDTPYTSIDGYFGVLLLPYNVEKS